MRSRRDPLMATEHEASELERLWCGTTANQSLRSCHPQGEPAPPAFLPIPRRLHQCRDLGAANVETGMRSRRDPLMAGARGFRIRATLVRSTTGALIGRAVRSCHPQGGAISYSQCLFPCRPPSFLSREGSSMPRPWRGKRRNRHREAAATPLMATEHGASGLEPLWCGAPRER